MLKIDTSVMKDGSELLNEQREESGGIPWFAILDGDGKQLVNSTGPDGNCGCPVAPKEIDHFITMIKETSSDPSEDSLAEIRSSLEEFTAKWR